METNVKEENVTINEVEEEVNDFEEVEETTEPKKKTSFGSKVKAFGKKAWTGVKKVAPYAGAFVAGAGAAVGTLLVMTRPDGTEVQGCLEKDEDYIPADDFIEGEVVEETEE